MVKRTAQCCIILIPIALFIWLLWVDICPAGVKEVVLFMNGKSPYIHTLLPESRVSDVQFTERGEAFIAIEEDPVYFSAKLPHTDFQEVEVELAFQSMHQPMVELGGLVDVFAQGYDLKPIAFDTLDDLDWCQWHKGDVRLLQAQCTDGSFDDFTQNLPDHHELGLYHYDINEPYRMEDYVPLNTSQTIDVSLRGYHQYATYLGDGEPFFLSVEYMDMNRTSGADDAVIRVRNQEDLVVFEYRISDDRNELDNELHTQGIAVIDQPSWGEGVYQVELSGTSDLFWRSITTSQKYVTFMDKVYIADDVGYLALPRATEFYTSAKHLTIETTHSDSVQTMRFGSVLVDIAESHEKVMHTIDDSGYVYGHTPVGDVKIIGDGLFAFSQEQFFDPYPITLNTYSDIDALGIESILTSYKTPDLVDGWSIASASFDLSDLAAQDDTIKFIISTPGIKEFDGEVFVKSITLRYKKDPMTWSEIASAIRALIPFGI